MLQPTSPKRNIIEFKRAINYYKKNKLDSLVGVTKVREHPNECLKLKKNKKWSYLIKKNKKIFQRQQYNNNFFFIDGSLYIVSIKFLRKNKSFVKENYTSIFKLKDKFSIDIDTKMDLKILNAIF